MTRDQLERYRMLVENIKDYAIFLLDTGGHIASWNQGAERLKGYSEQEIVGKHFSIFYPEIDKKNQKPEWELRESMKNGRVEDEGWRVRKDGTRFWANVVLTALFDKDGKHQGFAKVTRDLTERKKYEDSLHHANIKLEASYKELQLLYKTKDEFVSLASHQLRTPATGVKQYLGLLLGGYVGDVSESQKDFLLKAYQSNDRQIGIINDLLQVAQLDAGKVVLSKSRTDVGELVADIIDEQIDSFKARKQRVIFHLPPEEVTVVVDPVRFRMVVENLIDNASKYTPDNGKVTVTIKDEKASVKITVQDTGVGIAKKDMPKLFEKFSRIQNKHTQSVAGSGLGLYWANRIIELHDGKIEVSSTKNKGTTFSVMLPKVKINV